MISGVVRVDALVVVVDTQEAVDWDAVEATVANEDEGWYGTLSWWVSIRETSRFPASPPQADPDLRQE